MGQGQTFDLLSLPLSPPVLHHLLKQGYLTTLDIPPPLPLAQDVSTLNNRDLHNANLGCNNSEEAAGIRREIAEILARFGSTTGSSYQAGEQQQLQSFFSSITNSSSSSPQSPPKVKDLKSIITFCQSIDKTLGGGIALGEVSEIAGAAGTGKTTLALQISVDALLPSSYGGVQGEVIYVDTEGSFDCQRCLDLAVGLVEHIIIINERKKRKAAGSGSSPSTLDPGDFTPDKITQAVHVFRPTTLDDLVSVILTVPSFMRSRIELGHPPVKVLVVDSLAFLLRGGVNDDPSVYRETQRVICLIDDICKSFDVAGVVVNQMTTTWAPKSEPGQGCGGNSAAVEFDSKSLTPALGAAFAHYPATRLILSNTDQTDDKGSMLRKCFVAKSAWKEKGTGLFVIGTEGVRDAKIAKDGGKQDGG